MPDAWRFTRSLLVLVSSALCALACGGSATESAPGPSGGGANAGAGGSGGGKSTVGGGGATVCDEVRENYERQESTATSAPTATTCAVDSDCTILSDTGCGDYCTAWVVNVASKASITAQVESWAAANCSMCSFEIPPCVAIGISPVCVAGKCMQYHPI